MRWGAQVYRGKCAKRGTIGLEQGLIALQLRQRVQEEAVDRDVPIDERSLRILTCLLRAEGSLSSAQVGRQLGLTAAQVRYGLRYVESWLVSRGVRLVKTPRVGVHVRAVPTLKRKMLEELQSCAADSWLPGHGQRVKLLILALLETDAPVPAPELLRRLRTSRSSFFRTLASVREWCGQRKLRVEALRGKGFVLRGGEAAWRRATVDWLLASFGESELISVYLEGEWRSAASFQTALLRAAQPFLSRLDWVEADRLVAGLETREEGTLVDRAHMLLVLHVAVAVHRLRAGQSLKPDASASGATAKAQRGTLPRHLARHMLQEAGLEPGAVEELALATRIAEAMTGGFVRDTARAASPAGRLRAEQSATALAREAAKYLNARLFRDEELVRCLALELEPAGRGAAAPLDAPIWTPRTPPSPVSGFTRRVLTPILEQHGYAATEPLVQALAMHLETALERLEQSTAWRRVWVICGAGVATARNLIARLNLHLPQLQVMGLASAFELARDPAVAARADAIISTVPLDWVQGTPVLLVSPILTAEDVALLRSALELGTTAQAGRAPIPSDGGLSLLDLLQTRSVATHVDAASWEEVVERAGALLLAQGAVWPSYIEAMKDMIRLYGPYVVVAPGAALLHAGPEMGSKRLSMSLVVLRRGVAFGHATNDPVFVALAFSSIDHTTHVRAVGEAMTLLGNRSALRAMCTAGTAERVLKAVSEAQQTSFPSTAGQA